MHRGVLPKSDAKISNAALRRTRFGLPQSTRVVPSCDRYVRFLDYFAEVLTFHEQAPC